ncbi:MAG: polynucleotide adenylyltransferase PcnB [Betaproteobacteria bacterium]|nr:polynucleotide adenylyltransferase PcnB [Betaproteobacteria bacterium]
MIRTWLGRIFGRAAKAQDDPKSLAQAKPQVLCASAIGLDLSGVSQAAMRTCETLQQAGFEAFVVGGGVRDLLLGRRPKDFDVATNATPEQVLAHFRRARSIGRRFQIVHVYFGRELIEVSTFRAMQAEAETDAHGRVLKDNVWGSQQEDAARRDFTVNALYLDPIGDQLLDYHEGYRDLQARTLRMIGDPATRYREDPVRMLRVARFAAKLGFNIEAQTRAPIAAMADLLTHVPAARLFDELLKLLTSGHSLACIQTLRTEGLHHGLLPLLDGIFASDAGERFIQQALSNTDARIAADKSISPGFLLAALLWPQVLAAWQTRLASGEHNTPALMAAADDVLEQQSDRLAIQKRFAADMREIWAMQIRFERCTRTLRQASMPCSAEGDTRDSSQGTGSAHCASARRSRLKAPKSHLVISTRPSSCSTMAHALILAW